MARNPVLGIASAIFGGPACCRSVTRGWIVGTKRELIGSASHADCQSARDVNATLPTVQPEVSADPPKGTRLAAPARRIVKLLVFALVLHVFVVPQIGGARRALSVLGSVNPMLLAVAAGLEVLSFAAYARLTQQLLPVDERPSLPITFGAVMASTGVNHVVPGGAATTATVNYRLLGRAGVPVGSLGFALTTQAIGSAAVLNVMLWIALLVSIPTSGFQPIYATAAGVGALLMAGFAAGVFGMRRHGEVFADRVSSLVGRLPRIDAAPVRVRLVVASDQLDLLIDDRVRLRKVVQLAAANWLLDAAALWVSLAAFGHRPGIDGLLVAYGLANVMAAIPISPGGLGVMEAILIPTLIGFGTPRAEASIGVVVYRLINFWLPIPVGAISYLAVEQANAAEGRRSFRGEINEQIAHHHEVIEQ